MHERQEVGQFGEDLAAAHLIEAGLVVVARNWRASLEDVRGELDIIAREGAVLALVEVKTRRSSAAGGALLAVGWEKRRRLRRLAGLYLQDHPHPGPVRGDVITVDLQTSGTWDLDHLRGAW